MKKQILTIILLWLAISGAQAAHFYFYYDQPLSLSVLWSLRDWLVWFVLIGALHYGLRRIGRTPERSEKGLAELLVLAVLCGWLHILIIIFTDWLAGPLDRPFMEDVWHLYQKRWLQNLFVFFVFWLLLSHIGSKGIIASRLLQKAENEDGLRITDGRETHWLKVADIRYIEAAGNYLCVHTADQQLITRSTIKQMESRLSEQGFVRISRSCLINQSYIESCKRVSRTRVEIDITGGKRAAVGRTYWPSVRERLGV